MHFKSTLSDFRVILISFFISITLGFNAQTPGSTFYWIGDAGNWSDTSHWSNSSNGANVAILPGISDSVIFDSNSFTSPNQTVLVDDHGYFVSMDWSTISDNQFLKFDSTLDAHGNITLNNKLSILRNVNFSGIQFVKQSIFDADSASVDCAFTIIMDAIEDSLILADDLVMSDSSSCILFTGRLSTQGYTLKTGSLKSINNPSSGTDLRSIDISNSTLYLSLEFNSAGDTSLVFSADNSTIHIGDTLDYLNNLKTHELSFNDVFLNFKPLTTLQIIEGNNIFNKLTVLPGSRVHIKEGSTQKVTDSLTLNGNCKDMITIASSDTSSTANTANLIKLNSNLDFIGVGLQVKQINSLLGEILTTYHSIDNGGNDLGWVFDQTSSITSGFTANGPFCFGDTALFSNTSSTSGTINYSWQYDDDSYLESPAGLIEAHNDTILNFPQAPGIDTTSYGQILSWTEITDGQSLFSPVSGSATTVQGYESMNYNFTVAYRMELINGTGSDAYLVDMDDNPALASYEYQPRIKVYKNGNDFAANLGTSSVFDEYVFYEDTLPNGSIQIGADTVSFNVSAFNLLPTDSLTIYFGSDVTYTAVTNQPRWKSAIDTLGTDVSIDYQLIIDSIYFEASPVTSSFNLDTTQHVFESSGDFNVSLIAINEDNFCTDTTTRLVHINQPTVYLSTSEPDTTICIGDEVTFEAFSTITGVKFEYLYNGVSQNTQSVNDTLFVTNTLSNLDTLSVLAYENGCISDTMPQYVFVVNALPNYTFVYDDLDASICAGDSVLFTASSPDLSYEYSFLIDGIGVTPVSDTIGYYNTVGLLDNETISAVVVDDNGCTDTSSITFNVNPLPIVLLSESTGGNVICGNQSVTFSGIGSDLYEFFINGGNAQGPSANNEFITSSILAGDTISLTGSSSFGCLQDASETFTYIVNPAPNTEISSSDLDNSICSSEQISFTASGAALYQFFINDVSVQLGSENNYTGVGIPDNSTISVSGTIGGCTQESDDITLTVLDSPSTTLTNNDDGDNTICYGTTIIFTATGATNYEFLVNGVSQGAPSLQNTFETATLQNNEIITVIGESNTCLINSQQAISVLTNPVVDIFSDDIDNIICEQEAITITGVNATDYVFWVNGEVFQSLSNDNTLSDPTLPIGIDTIVVQGVSGNGCSDYSPELITTVNATPNIVLLDSEDDNEICLGDTVSFDATGGDLYQFFANGIPQGPLSSNNAFLSSSLNHGDSVIVQGSLLGCANTSNSIYFTVNAVPNVNLESSDLDNIFCLGSNILYTANGALSYEFLVDGLSQGSASNINEINSADFNTGTYSVLVTGESFGCSDSDEITVTVNELPEASLITSTDLTSICSGQELLFTASGGTTYQFYIDETSQGVVSINDEFSVSNLTNGNNVSVLVMTSQGCEDSVFTGPIAIYDSPLILMSSSIQETSICSGDNVEFSAVGSDNFEFMIGGVSLGASNNATITIDSLQNGEQVYVIGTSLNGCSGTSNTISFNVYLSPIVNLINNEDSLLCIGETTNIEATGATEYQFYINGQAIGDFNSQSLYLEEVNNDDLIQAVGSVNGCPSSLSNEILFAVYEYPTVNSSSSDLDNIICAQDTVVLSATGGQLYNFSLNGLLIGAGEANTYELTNIMDGDLVEVIALNGDCPSETDTFEFLVNQLEIGVSVSPGNILCANETPSFQAFGGDQYQFFINGEAQGGFSSQNTVGDLNINDLDEVSIAAYDDATGCYQKLDDYILMTVQETPTLSPSGNSTLCEGDSILLISNYELGTQWFLDGIEIPGAINNFYYAHNMGEFSITGTYGGQGEIWSIGDNASGIHGNGNNINSGTPQMAMQNILPFASIYSTNDFIIGIDEQGNPFAWGNNNTGQLGNGSFTSSNTPIQIPGVSTLKNCATSKESVMAVNTSGEVYIWGGNSEGELGLGTNSVVNFPMENTSIVDVDTIAAGLNHFIILKNNGTVWSVGNNEFGQLGIGTNTNSNVPVLINGLSNIASIGAGHHHSFAIDSSGQLVAWGNNSSGQLGTGDLNNRLSPQNINVTAIQKASGGNSHSLILNEMGEVLSCGDDSFGQLGQISSNSTFNKIEIIGVKQISAGPFASLFLRNDHSVFGCGRNTENQISNESNPLYSEPIHLEEIHGVGSIVCGEKSTHFIYTEMNSCVSNNASITVLNTPEATISISGDTLYASSGDYHLWYINGVLISDAELQYYVPLSSGNYTVEIISAEGCSGTSEVLSFEQASVQDLETLRIRLYPNPAIDQLHIVNDSHEEVVKLIIYDQIGKVVLESENTDQSNSIINLKGLLPGNYYVAIYTDNNKVHLRFNKIN